VFAEMDRDPAPGVLIGKMRVTAASRSKVSEGCLRNSGGARDRNADQRVRDRWARRLGMGMRACGGGECNSRLHRC